MRVKLRIWARQGTICSSGYLVKFLPQAVDRTQMTRLATGKAHSSCAGATSWPICAGWLMPPCLTLFSGERRPYDTPHNHCFADRTFFKCRLPRPADAAPRPVAGAPSGSVKPRAACTGFHGDRHAAAGAGARRACLAQPAAITGASPIWPFSSEPMERRCRMPLRRKRSPVGSRATLSAGSCRAAWTTPALCRTAATQAAFP